MIIGAAGGNEVQAALTYGVGHVDAVELNPVTVSMLRGQFADYAGNITTNPKVDYRQGDGRTFLARSDDAYDLIWFVAPDSYAAANAATSG
ncbi:MAG: class I SAM-dependent methyltransferase, partial [Acidimicrobiia bacterium]|nr:class I SAM-dependent methyltransferase [Acidimicrobiia bacterium]